MNNAAMDNLEQTGGELDAQNASADGTAQLQPSEAHPGVPPGEGAGQPAGAAGAEDAAAGEGTAGEAARGAADEPQHSPAAEAAPAADERHAEAEARAQEAAQRADLAAVRLGEALAHAALREAGVPADRAARALKVMELDGIDPMAEDARDAYAEAARKLVAEIPEFVPASAGTGASGEHPRRAGTDDTAANFRRGMGR